MRCGGFSIGKYKKPSGICCDLCYSDENSEPNLATVQVFIFKHSYNLCSKCYNEIRDTFIKCELKEDENEEE